MTRKCENCDYWCRYSKGGSGECRRHAPAPMYSMTGDKPCPIWWPQTLANFWCGDYSERVHADAGHYLEVPDAEYHSAWNALVAKKSGPARPKEQQASDDILDKEVWELDLGTRIMNVFKQEDIHTIRDIIARPENEWLRTPNFGYASLNKLMEALKRKFNLYLHTTHQSMLRDE